MDASPSTSPTERGRVPIDARRRGPDRHAPLIIVGSARSGSSLLTLMLNRGADAFIINDAYAAQIAEGLGLGLRSDPRKLAVFRAACLDRIAERSVASGEAPIHRSAVADQEARFRAQGATGGNWGELWADMLCRAAGERAVWGWNTPPDFTRASEYLKLFPRARILFLLRNPYEVLRSYKNLPDYWGRERRRYHPTLQSWAWRRAATTYEKLVERAPERVGLVRYEHLIAEPGPTLRRLGVYLDAPVTEVNPAAIPGNGSPGDAILTRVEIAAARLALSGVAARFGYHPPAGAPGGAGELLRLTARAGGYYATEAARSQDMRNRIRRLVRA